MPIVLHHIHVFHLEIIVLLFTGKFMHMKVKADKAPVNDAPQDDKADTVCQIKKRYGYTASAVSSLSSIHSIFG